MHCIHPKTDTTPKKTLSHRHCGKLTHTRTQDLPRLMWLLPLHEALTSCRRALLLLDLGTVRHDGPELEPEGFFRPVSLRETDREVSHTIHSSSCSYPYL
jgi:hypothetical protein